MNFYDFMSFLLDDSLEDARYDYLRGKHSEEEFKAVEQAIDECRQVASSRRLVTDMRALLAKAETEARASEERPQYLYLFTRAACVNWIASVISVPLSQFKIGPIVDPSNEAIKAAARLTYM